MSTRAPLPYSLFAETSVTTLTAPTRFVVHSDGRGRYVSHEKRGKCVRRGDDYCLGITGGATSTGARNFERLVAEAHDTAAMRWRSFIDALQARGKDFS